MEHGKHSKFFILYWGFPRGSVVKNLPANAGDMCWVPELGRFPGEGNSNPLQYSCLENPMDKGAWGNTGKLGLTYTHNRA